jgi:hypothetical protein
MLKGISPQNKEDEGTPTSQNTICNTAGFTPQNPPPTQPLEHHSPPRVVISKFPPHITPLQNSPPTQPLEHHSLLHQSPPHTTILSSQNPPTEQALQHLSSPRIVVSKSPPHTTPALQNPPPTQPLKHHSSLRQSPPHITTPPQNPPTEQAFQHRSPQYVHSLKSHPHTTPPSLQLHKLFSLILHHVFLLQCLLLILPLLIKILQRPQRSRMPLIIPLLKIL